MARFKRWWAIALEEGETGSPGKLVSLRTRRGDVRTVQLLFEQSRTGREGGQAWIFDFVDLPKVAQPEQPAAPESDEDGA